MTLNRREHDVQDRRGFLGFLGTTTPVHTSRDLHVDKERPTKNGERRSVMLQRPFTEQ